MDYKEIWQAIYDRWLLVFSSPFASAISSAVACITFLIGDPTADAFIALWGLVVLDTLTRWMAIGKKYIENHKLHCSIVTGMLLAFLDGYINTDALRGQFFTKALSYVLLLIAFNQLGHIVPEKIFSHSLVGLPNTFISTWLAWVELQSIIENLVEVGMSELAPLGGRVRKIRDKLTKGDE